MTTNNIVVYTCITGDYDGLREIKNKSSNVDYICFTDNSNLTSETWMMRPIPDDLKYLTKVKQQRLVKICPHKYLPEYEISIWVDGNISVECDISKDFLPTLDLDTFFMYTKKHLTRDCIYDEEKAVLSWGKDKAEITGKQMKKYRAEKFPEHFGLCETNIIVRKHNSFNCKRLMFMWAIELVNGSHRDQLSFNYCLWKTGQKIGYIDKKYWLDKNNGYFVISKHGNVKSGNELPTVNVVITTHNRTRVAKESIMSLIRHLKYQNLSWIISDDRSDGDHVEQLQAIFSDMGITSVTVCRTTDEAYGLGASMNNGLKMAFKTSDIVLTTEDDWILEKDLDITKSVLLIKNNPISAIRLATLIYANPAPSKYEGMIKVVPDLGKPSKQSVFNNQVALRHKRIYDKIGYYKENVHSDISEQDMIKRYNEFAMYGNGKDYEVLFPDSFKRGTYDDPSLCFIHVGQSTCGHSNFKIPSRYDYLYSESIQSKKKQSKMKPSAVTVILTTHNRTVVASAVIDSLIKNLKYHDLRWCITDDRSDPGHVEALVNRFKVHKINDVIVCRTSKEKFGLGASMNNGLKMAFKTSDVVLTVEDDWILERELDIEDYVDIITNDTSVAGIRLANLNKLTRRNGMETTLRQSDYESLYTIKSVLRNKNCWIYNNQVMLRHKRVYDKLGYYPENCNSDVMETYMNDAYCKYTDNGYNGKFVTLFPKSIKTDTLDHSSLFFIHVGKSTVNHGFKVPTRYEYLYHTHKKFHIVMPHFETDISLVKRALDSIKNQTFSDYSVTIVDDCSSIECVSNLENCLKEYPFVELIKSKIHVDGGGCRNIATSNNMNCDYTTFLDSDDYYSTNDVLEKLKDLIDKKSAPDMVLMSFIVKDSKTSKFTQLVHKNKYSTAMAMQAPWTVCVKTSLMCKFQDHRKRFNDVLWYMRTCDVVNTIINTDFPCVTYTTDDNKNSVQHGTMDNDRISALYYLVGDLINEKFVCDDIKHARKVLIERKCKTLQDNKNYADRVQ